MNIREEIAKETRRIIKREPFAQLDATLMVDSDEIPLTLSVYGNKVRGFPGSRETPEEFAGFEVDDVTVGHGDDERSIYAALSEEDIEVLALHVEE